MLIKSVTVQHGPSSFNRVERGRASAANPEALHPHKAPRLPTTPAHLQACAALRVRVQKAADHVPAAGADALGQRLTAPGLHVEQRGCQVVGLGWVLW